MKPILYEAWRRFPEKGACHPQEVEGVIVPEKVKRGLWDGVTAHGGRHRDAWGESCAGGIGLQVNANAMDVLGVLQEEPGAGEVLLTSGTYIAGGLIPSTCVCVLLLGANSFDGRPPLSLLTCVSSADHFLLLLWRHLDANLHRLRHFPQLVLVLQAVQGGAPPTPASLLTDLVGAAIGQQLTQFFLVLDKKEDVAQREGHLTLAAGQQVMVRVEAGGRGVGQRVGR